MAASHTRAVWSSLAVTTRRPSGLNARVTSPCRLCLSGGVIGWPVAASHTRAVLSSLAVTTRRPSGLNAASYTTSVVLSSGGAIGWPVAASHTRAVWSLLGGDDAAAVGAERRVMHHASVLAAAE